MQARVEVIAEAEIQSETAGYFPVILKVSAICLSIHDLSRIFFGVLGGIGGAEEEAGECIAGARGKGTWQRSLRRAEGEVAVVVTRLKVRKAVEADLAASFDAVTASENGDVIEEREHALVILQ